MSDRGIPLSFRHMHGFGSHTFKWVNAAGEVFFVKYHFKTNQGIKNLESQLAEEIAGKTQISILKICIMQLKIKISFLDIICANYPVCRCVNNERNSFDVTKTVSQKEYPLIEVGTMTLNRNPENYFAEVEQVTFSPGNFVHGIEASPDKLLQGRLFAYGDAHRHRVGANSHQLPINQAKAPVNNYQKDGNMRFNNGNSEINYEPNSYTETQKKILQRKLVPLKLKEMLVIIAIIKITLHKQTLCIICCQAKKKKT